MQTPVVWNKLNIEVYWVAKRERTSEYSIDNHMSPFTMFWFILDGSKTIHLGGRKYSISANDLVLMPPGTPISVPSSSDASDRLTYLALGCKAKAETLDIFKVFQFPHVIKLENPTDKGAIIELWTQLISESERLQTASDIDKIFQTIMFYGKVYQLVAQFIQALSNQCLFEKEEPVIDKRLHEAFMYIHKEFESRPNIQEIASHACLSVPHLRTLFRQALGISPMQYLHEVRMSYAREMLSIPRLSIREIAERLGYPEQSQFSRVFNKTEGMSPLEYRQKFQQIYNEHKSI